MGFHYVWKRRRTTTKCCSKFPSFNYVRPHIHEYGFMFFDLLSLCKRIPKFSWNYYFLAGFSIRPSYFASKHSQNLVYYCILQNTYQWILQSFSVGIHRIIPTRSHCANTVVITLSFHANANACRRQSHFQHDAVAAEGWCCMPILSVRHWKWGRIWRRRGKSINGIRNVRRHSLASKQSPQNAFSRCKMCAPMPRDGWLILLECKLSNFSVQRNECEHETRLLLHIGKIWWQEPAAGTHKTLAINWRPSFPVFVPCKRRKFFLFQPLHNVLNTHGIYRHQVCHAVETKPRITTVATTSHGRDKSNSWSAGSNNNNNGKKVHGKWRQDLIRCSKSKRKKVPLAAGKLRRVVP